MTRSQFTMEEKKVLAFEFQKRKGYTNFMSDFLAEFERKIHDTRQPC